MQKQPDTRQMTFLGSQSIDSLYDLTQLQKACPRWLFAEHTTELDDWIDKREGLKQVFSLQAVTLQKDLYFNSIGSPH